MDFKKKLNSPFEWNKIKFRKRVASTFNQVRVSQLHFDVFFFSFNGPFCSKSSGNVSERLLTRMPCRIIDCTIEKSVKLLYIDIRIAFVEVLDLDDVLKCAVTVAIGNRYDPFPPNKV